MTITLSGEPKSTQHLYKYACRPFPKMYMTKEGQARKQAYQWEAKSQWRGKPRTDELEVWITLYFGTKRRADWDNFHKVSLDALTGIVWSDDSLIKEAHVRVCYDKQNPRIEITV